MLARFTHRGLDSLLAGGGGKFHQRRQCILVEEPKTGLTVCALRAAISKQCTENSIRTLLRNCTAQSANGKSGLWFLYQDALTPLVELATTNSQQRIETAMCEMRAHI